MENSCIIMITIIIIIIIIIIVINFTAICNTVVERYKSSKI